MKKLFAILVAIAMVLTLTVTALADAGGPLKGDENNVKDKAINASSAELKNIQSDDGEISRNTDGTVVEKLAEGLRPDELAPYVFSFKRTGTTGDVTIKNIEIIYPYEFLRVWYEEGGSWHEIIGGRYTPTNKEVTFPLPDGFDGPIAITVVRTTGGGDVPVSPQTGEMTTAAYLLGAAVMAVACAAFVVKSRKAA